MCDFTSFHIFIYPLVMTNIAKMTIEIVDFPIKHGDFPYSYVSLPEGIFYLILSYPCTKRIHPALTPLRSRGTSLGSGLSRGHSAATFRSSGGCGGRCRDDVSNDLLRWLSVEIFFGFVDCYICYVPEIYSLQRMSRSRWSKSMMLIITSMWCPKIVYTPKWQF